MMDLLASPEQELNDAVKDLYVTAVTARDGTLNTKSAGALADRLRWHGERMALSHQRDLFHRAADTLESLSNATTRIKAQTDRTKAKASYRKPIPPRQPSAAEFSAAFDEITATQASAFQTDTYEQDEAERVAAQNEQLAERNRGFEAQRSAQIAEDEPTETPWWRR